MLRLVHLVLVVSIFRLERVGTTSLCGEQPHLCIHMQLKEELSSNGSSVPSKAEALESPGHIGHVSTLIDAMCMYYLKFPIFWNKMNTWVTYLLFAYPSIPCFSDIVSNKEKGFLIGYLKYVFFKK